MYELGIWATAFSCQTKIPANVGRILTMTLSGQLGAILSASAIRGVPTDPAPLPRSVHLPSVTDKRIEVVARRRHEGGRCWGSNSAVVSTSRPAMYEIATFAKKAERNLRFRRVDEFSEYSRVCGGRGRGRDHLFRSLKDKGASLAPFLNHIQL